MSAASSTSTLTAERSVATIYAVGDVTGGPLLAHVATAQGMVAAENACGRYSAQE